MGGGGKGKGGGGGGGGAPDFNIPQGLLQGAASETGLGQYATAVLNPLAAMTGWASSLATGRNIQVPTPQQFATQAGPGASFGGGKEWATQFDPTTSQVTFTNPGNPRQTFVMGINDPNLQGVIPPSYLQNWQQAAGSYQQYQATQAAGAGPSQAQMTPQLALAWQDIQAQQAATGQMPGIEAQTQAFLSQAGRESAKYQAQGDVQLQQAQDIFGTAAGQEAQAGQFFQKGDVQEQQAQQLFGTGYAELSDADKAVVDANALIQMTTTGQGLFPAQQAMIEQARQAEETQLASSLGGVGLGRSTQLGQLTGAADLASAAAAGQLQQANIQAAEQVMQGALGQRAGAQQTLGLGLTQEQIAAQTYGLGISEQQVAGQTRTQAIQEQQIAQQSYQLSQAVEKLTLAGQELLTGEQAQLTQELQNITTQSTQFHQVLWGEAMQGYGLIGDMLSRSAQSYGMSLQAYSNVLNAMEHNNQIQAGMQEAAMSADAQGTSTLFGGLGQLLGGTKGLAGLGGIGGLIGGGGAAAGGIAAGGAAAAAGAGGAAAGASGIGISAAVTAVGAAI